MNKILGISIAAMLAVSPMLANADTITPADTNSTPFAGVTVTTTGNDAETGHIASTAYVKGAYNAAIGAVNTRQAQLMNNAAGTAQPISATVKTVLGDATGANAATDTELVTAKAVRDAIDSAAGDANTALSGAAGSGLVWNSTNTDFDVNLKKDTSNNNANISGLEIASDELAVKTGDGITINATSGAVEANLTTNGGLTTTGTAGQKTISVADGDGIKITSNGVEVDLVTNGGLAITSGQLGVEVDSTTITKNGSGQLTLANGVQAAATPATYTGTGLTTKGYVDEKVATTTANMAVENGVRYTIHNTAITVPVYKAWGTDSGDGATNTVTATVALPTYMTADPAPSGS